MSSRNVFSAGSDHVIRAWSLDSGALVGQKVIPGTPTQLTTVRYGSSESKPILTNDGHPVWSGLFVSHGPEITMLSRP